MSLASIRARVEAATEGEWHAEEIVGEYHIVDWYPFGDSIGEFYREGDAEFAAHAKHDIPLLLKVAEAAKAQLQMRNPETVAALRAALAELESSES